MATATGVTTPDGSLDFSLGVNSVATTTVASQRTPAGLPRNALAWLINGVCRDGGVTTRYGLDYKAVVTGGGRFQGEYIYEPTDGTTPYYIMSVSGRIYKVVIDTGTVTDLSTISGLTNPATADHAYFVQAEQFLVIQAGDMVTLPLFWDGATLRRSNGLGGPTTTPGTITITNVSDAGNVGSNIFPQTVTFGTYIVNTTATAVVPIVGGTVVVAGTVSGGTLPTTNFTLITSTGPGIVAYSVTAATNASTTTNNPELPAAQAMDYFMGRIWYAQGRQYSAGDIVQGPSGTLAYNFLDSVLKVTENPLAVGGDGFRVPDNAGNIRALKHNANLDSVLGQGQLFAFTRKAIYSLQVPVSRADWINASANNQPKQSVVQLVNGSVNDRSIVPVNGDLFYQSLEPSIRSLISALRYFDQWGNIPISANELLVWRSNNRGLMEFSSGTEFDNRLLQAVLPETLGDNVVSKGIIPLDFVPISTFNSQVSPVWEGVWEGHDYLQLSRANFGGRERAFATVVSRKDGSIQIHEFTENLRFDRTKDGENRITMEIRFPAFTWDEEFSMKKVVACEIWVDRVWGQVDFLLEWRPDGDTCWHKWHQWQICSARSCLDDIDNPCVGYPTTPADYGEGFRSTMLTPKPPEDCTSLTGRPAHIGYQFQPRLTIKGFCRIRGLLLHATKFERKLYEGFTC